MLPVMTKPDDALAVVGYLNTKVTGATLKDAKATIEPRLLDHRKLAGYVAWGLLSKEADQLRLTARGRQLARASEGDRYRVFADIILDTHPYLLAAEWMHHRGVTTISLTDVASHWFEHIPGDLGTETETTIRNQAACFLGLAQGAGLGTYKVGRRGQPTRLEVDSDALAQMVARSDNSEAPSKPEGRETGTGLDEVGVALETDGQQEDEGAGEGAQEMERGTSPHEAVRVFIGHGRCEGIVDQVKTMLDVTEMSYEVVIGQESAAIPVPQKVFDAMRRCNAAVICVTADAESEREDGSYDINPNVLIEIGAAFVLYDKRVVLIWDRRIPVPSNLQGLYRCETEGDQLSWSTGMKLMKAIKDFRSPTASAP